MNELLKDEVYGKVYGNVVSQWWSSKMLEACRIRPDPKVKIEFHRSYVWVPEFIQENIPCKCTQRAETGLDAIG